MSTAFNTDRENDALIKTNKESSSKSWSTTQLVLISIIIFCVAVIVSNMDRIIDLLSNDNESSSDTINDDINVDILIVGGGATGMIEMHFLQQKYPEKRILLIEKQHYIGGRTLSSIVSYNNKQITIDMGAWRTSYQPLLWQIIYYLDLCDDLTFFYDENISNPEPILYFRNNIIYNWTSNVVYKFTEFDKKFIVENINPYSIIYNDILIENNNGIEPETLNEWILKFYQSNWTLNGIPIIQYSVQSAFRNYLNLSNEYIKAQYQLNPFRDLQRMSLIRGISRSGVVGLNYSNITDDDLLYDHDTMKTFKNGYMSIINGFYQKIMSADHDDNNHDPIWLNTQLIGIDYNVNNDKYKYLVEIDSINDKYNNISYINAENVILSIDIQSLQQLVPDLIPIRNELQFGINDISCSSFINCLTFKTKLYRIVLIYDIKDIELLRYLSSKSRSRTDLEINDFFLLGSSSNSDTLRSVVLYPKHDSECIFWDQLQRIGPKYEINTNLTINNIESLSVASKEVVNRVMLQINELLSLSNNNLTLGLPLAAFVKGFGVNENDIDGINEWRQNIDIPAISEWIKHPNKNETIFISMTEYNVYMGSPPAAQRAYQFALQFMQKYFNVSNPFKNMQKCPPP